MWLLVVLAQLGSVGGVLWMTGRLPTWFSEQQLSHGLRAARWVFSHALIKSFIRLHQTQNLEVAAVLCSQQDTQSGSETASQCTASLTSSQHRRRMGRWILHYFLDYQITTYTASQCCDDYHYVLYCAVVTCILIPCAFGSFLSRIFQQLAFNQICPSDVSNQSFNSSHCKCHSSGSWMLATMTIELW